MPVSTLFVEGRGKDPVDSTILRAVLEGRPVVLGIGSKGSLKPKAQDERERKVVTCYLRDRDFDFDPPADRSTPTVDAYVSASQGEVLGWRWCRHAIESYLIDPRLFSVAAGITESSVSEALIAAAGAIHGYTAARWAVGVARRSLPPSKEFPTRPPFRSEFAVPEWGCLQDESAQWAREHTKGFRDKMDSALSDDAVESTFEAHLRILRGILERRSVEEILTWYSGKDLMASLDPRVYRGFADNPTTLRRALRNWVRDNAEAAVAFFPEWASLRAQLRQ